MPLFVADGLFIDYSDRIYYRLFAFGDGAVIIGRSCAFAYLINNLYTLGNIAEAGILTVKRKMVILAFLMNYKELRACAVHIKTVSCHRDSASVMRKRIIYAVLLKFALNVFTAAARDRADLRPES